MSVCDTQLPSIDSKIIRQESSLISLPRVHKDNCSASIDSLAIMSFGKLYMHAVGDVTNLIENTLTDAI